MSLIPMFFFHPYYGRVHNSPLSVDSSFSFYQEKIQILFLYNN